MLTLKWCFAEITVVQEDWNYYITDKYGKGPAGNQVPALLLREIKLKTFNSWLKMMWSLVPGEQESENMVEMAISVWLLTILLGLERRQMEHLVTLCSVHSLWITGSQRLPWICPLCFWSVLSGSLWWRAKTWDGCARGYVGRRAARKSWKMYLKVNTPLGPSGRLHV